ncbi:MAG: transporter [Verrucomicrobia bacterium]|nr:MAG: transporter [Verrucomicrobiota bacterium]
MSFTAWAHGHARSILFLFGSLALAGAVASFLLPVSLFPQVSFPRVRITLDSGDRPAEQMTVEVTTPVEEAVRAIPGVRSLRSTTSRGTAEISVNFNWGEDMVSAMLQCQSQVNKILPSLPTGTSFEVERMDPTVFPVIAYSLTSDSHSLIELRDLALYTLRPALSTVSGVARVGVQGGRVEEYRVTVDPDKLQSFNMTLADVASALSASNVLVAVGRLEQYDKLYLVVSDTRFKNFDEIEHTVLRSTPDGVVLLDDVATVEHSAEPQWVRVTADGHDAVLFQVYQQPSGNTVEIARGIKAKLREIRKQIPEGVKIADWYDQSELIIASEHSTRDAIVIGMVLAAFVLLIFLRDWKVTLIAILTVPAVLAATILLLYVLKMSFNILTLGGMAAAVGLIIDDAIVMVEHIVRRVRAAREGDPRAQVLSAAREFTNPLAGSSAATIIIFTPLAFLSGVTGAFFKALSLTMAASLIISFVVAWLAVPILCARLLKEKDAEIEEHGRFTRRVHEVYRDTMQGLLQQPRLVNYISPPGTSLAETDRLLRQVESILQETPEVQTYSRRTGLQLGGGVTEANIGDFFVRLKPFPRRGIEEVMNDVRDEIEKRIPGLQVELLQLMEDLIGDLTAVPQPIEIKLYSDDDQLLRTLPPRVADTISKVRGVVEVKSGIVPAGDALNIQVDRVKVALEGMDPEAVTKALNNFLAGNVTTHIQQGPKLIGVRVWIPRDAREIMRNIDNLLLRAPDGHLFPLKRVATLLPLSGQPEIMRDDLKRMIAVTTRISGRDLGSTVGDVKRALARSSVVPNDVLYTFGGLYEQQQIAFRGLTIILIAAIILVFLLLLFLYESFRVAFAMLLVPIFAVAGVFIGLWITGTEFNVTSRMGMTMIVGIVTEIAIFYYSEFRSLPASNDRLITAGINRMRAISMTAFAAILALLPLALGIGRGAAMQQPLAIAIISGLIFSLPLVLIALPALLAILEPKTATQ